MTIESRLTEMNYRAERATGGVWAVYMDHKGDPEIRTNTSKPDVDKLAILREGERDVATTALDMYFAAHARTDLPTLIYALRKVLKPHQPIEIAGATYCTVCTDWEDTETASPALWPCETRREAARALGETE